MKIELTIKVDYLPTWGMNEGIRELLQNAKDAETEFSAPMTVRMRGETLVIENEGCTMPYEALLLGHSTKAERGDLIGKFGEGFKLGILALLRKGHAVKIRNGSEVWTPEIVWSEKFTARVLAFDIQKGRKDDNRIQIEISDVGAERFATEIKPRFRWLSKGSDTNTVSTDSGTLLLSPECKGKVFVKGIFIENKTDLTVGYDLHDADVDRDRRMVESFDFGWKTRKIWGQALATRPDLFGTYHAILEQNGPEARDVSSYDVARLPQEFVDHVADAFQARHGGKALPVQNLGESQELEHFGRLGVIVNSGMRAVLESKFGTLDKVREDLKTEVTRTYGWHELTEAQKANLTRAIRLLSVATSVSLDEINVVDFRSASLDGVFSPGGAILLSAKICQNASDTLATLVHEVAHRSGSDGEKGHVAEIEHLWAAIVQSLST